MKITLCDNCLSNKKMTPTTRYIRVPNHPELRLDICTACGTEQKLTRIPMAEYTPRAQEIQRKASEFILKKSR
jgi:hypothetical protein